MLARTSFGDTDGCCSPPSAWCLLPRASLALAPGAQADMQCTPGFYSATGNAPCTQTHPADFTSVLGATTETPCTPGQYQPAPQAESSCIPADIGHYATGPSATAQTPALPALTQPRPARRSATPPIRVMWWLIPAAPPRRLCLPGTYQPNAQETSCIPAQAGHYATGPAATAQTLCLAGSYAATSGCGPFATPPIRVMWWLIPVERRDAVLARLYQPDSGEALCDTAMPGSRSPEAPPPARRLVPADNFRTRRGKFRARRRTRHFAAGPAAVAQTECPAGSYAASSGQSACTPASPGHDVTGTGATARRRARRARSPDDRTVRVHAGESRLRRCVAGGTTPNAMCSGRSRRVLATALARAARRVPSARRAAPAARPCQRSPGPRSPDAR